MAAKKSRRSRGDEALFNRADRDRWVGRISVNGTPRTVSARTKTEARYKLDQLSRTVDDVEAALTRRTIPADEQPTPRKGRGRTATSALSRNSLIKLRSTLSQHSPGHSDAISSPATSAPSRSSPPEPPPPAPANHSPSNKPDNSSPQPPAPNSKPCGS